MFKTLNNDVAKHIIMYAVEGKTRFCAYSLYNHFYGNTFEPAVFRRLYYTVLYILDDKAKQMLKDDTIDYCVRDFLNRFYPTISS